ncbi:MAG: hypothetical protein KDD70_07970, partial [Bdellovibrionales bacterium]|nr:hypothetical protein [Bdellovibrionales bacterium]
ALRQIAEHGGAAGRAFLVALAQGQIDYEASPYELPQEGMKVIDAHVRKLAEAQLLEPPAARAEMHVALRELHSEDLMIDNPIKAILLLKDRIRTHPAGDEQDAAVWSLALNYGEDGRIALQDLSMELAGNSASALFKNVSEQITSNLEQEFRIEGPSAVENAQRAIQLLDELSKSSDRSEPCSMEEREQIVDAARTLDSIVYDEAELNSALLVQASSTLGKAAARRLGVLIERSAAEPNTALVVSALIATKTHEGLLSLENHLAGEVLPLLRIAAKDPERDESQRSLAARIYWDHISKEELLKAPEVALFPMLGPQKDGEALALEANQWDLKSALTLHRHLMEQDVIEGSPLPEPTIRLLAQLKSDTQLIDLSAQEREILFRFSTLSIERVSSGTPSSSREIAADILLKNGEHQQMLKRMLLESAPDVIAHIVNGSKGDSLIQILKDAPSDEAIQMLQRYLVSDDVKRDERLALLVTDGTDLTLRERALKELPADSTLRTETIETLRLRAVKAEEDNERVAARTLLNSIDVATSAWENLWDRVRFSVRRRR